MGQGTVAKILSLTAPCSALKNLDPSPNIFEKLRKNFLGVGRLGGPGAEIYGVAPKSVGGIDSGPPDVQNKVGTGALGLTFWPQKSREKVKKK